jgi:hypothetical protein
VDFSASQGHLRRRPCHRRRVLGRCFAVPQGRARRDGVEQGCRYRTTGLR